MFKKVKYKDFIDLSVGRVYLKPITHGIINKVELLCLKEDEFNNALYFTLVERFIVCLSKKKYNNLPITEGNKLRAKVIELLKEGGLVETIKKRIDSNADIFSKHDVEWFNNSKKNCIK